MTGTTTEKTTDHLILSALPTPNGELHLGHIGGPFLAADALARHLRAEGHRVTTVSATDSWESYVLDAARAENRSPRATAADYHTRIRRALAETGTEPDVFLDVTAEPHAAAHRGWHHRVAERLLGAGRVETRTERLLADAVTGEELIACWLSGRCPNCDAGAAGYTCEGCGMWFQPGALRDAAPRHPRARVTGAATSSAFLRLGTDRLLAMAHERGVTAPYRQLIRSYVDQNGPAWRLTHPLGWGIPWTTTELPARQVHFTYALGTTATFLLAGQEHADRHGLPDNPLLPDAAAPRPRFTLCFGMDGALPLLMQLAVQEAAGLPSAPDEYRFNAFMTMDGAKFSTSRRHVIRVLDYTAAGLDTDALRFHLARLSPEDKATDFAAETFAEDVAVTLVGRLGHALALCEDHPAARPAGPAILARYEDCVTRQRAAFAPGGRLSDAAAVVDDWMAAAPDVVPATGAPGYLTALVALAAPLMPRWTARMRACLGLQGEPAPAAAGRLLAAGHGMAPVRGTLPRFAPVSAPAVRALVPQSD